MSSAHLLGLEGYTSYDPVKMATDGDCEGQPSTEALFCFTHRSHRTTSATKATFGGCSSWNTSDSDSEAVSEVVGTIQPRDAP
jgi:hypothetical protein